MSCNCRECVDAVLLDCVHCDGLGEHVNLTTSPFKTATCKHCAGTSTPAVPLTEVRRDQP